MADAAAGGGEMQDADDLVRRATLGLVGIQRELEKRPQDLHSASKRMIELFRDDFATSNPKTFHRFYVRLMRIVASRLYRAIRDLFGEKGDTFSTRLPKSLAIPTTARRDMAKELRKRNSGNKFLKELIQRYTSTKEVAIRCMRILGAEAKAFTVTSAARALLEDKEEVKNAVKNAKAFNEFHTKMGPMRELTLALSQLYTMIAISVDVAAALRMTPSRAS
jgi:hypothetical protein